jgi:hypothetical protein
MGCVVPAKFSARIVTLYHALVVLLMAIRLVMSSHGRPMVSRTGHIARAAFFPRRPPRRRNSVARARSQQSCKYGLRLVVQRTYVRHRALRNATKPVKIENARQFKLNFDETVKSKWHAARRIAQSIR